MKIKLLPLLLLFSCTTGELEQVYKDVANAKILEACDEVSAGSGLTLTDCTMSLSGDVTEDVNLVSNNSKQFSLWSSDGGTNNGAVNISQDQVELYAEEGGIRLNLINSSFTILGLSTTAASDQVWRSNGLLKYGPAVPLSDQGVRAGSVFGQTGTSFTVNIGTPAPVNGSYKVSITPTNAAGATTHFVSGKTTTSFTITYTSSVTLASFDWIITP